MAVIKDRGVILVTGNRGSGKTTFCSHYSQEMKSQGWRVGGILSLPVFENGQKSAIEVMDLTSQERKIFATLTPGCPQDIILGIWAIKPEAIGWGNAIFKDAHTLDLLIVDELGPLEFMKGEGWYKAFEALNRVGVEIQQALVVVRPELRKQAYQKLPISREIEIKDNRIIEVSLR